MRLERKASGTARIFLLGEAVAPEVDGDVERVWVQTESAALTLKRTHGYTDVDMAQDHPIGRTFTKRDRQREAWERFLKARNGREEERLGTIGDARRAVGVWQPENRADHACGNVAVVLTMTGWGDAERDAVERALWAMDDYKAEHARITQVIAVQNDPRFHCDLETLEPRRQLVRVKVTNRGFAAACNSGLKRVRDRADWVLFTQQDAFWDGDEVDRALRTAHSYCGYRHEDWRIVVGPSGGFINPDGSVREVGRNIGQNSGVSQVDFVAGYWLMAPRRLLQDAGGWDDGYFLFYEDPDLCLRLAMRYHAVASIVDTAINVQHYRNSTVRAAFTKGTKDRIQEWSRQRFRRRWGS